MVLAYVLFILLSRTRYIRSEIYSSAGYTGPQDIGSEQYHPGAESRPDCAKSTVLSYCLDDPNYPIDAIQKEINRNYGEFYKMYAEVANQSASSLVDGVSDKEESRYDYAFYYGNKKNIPTSPYNGVPSYMNYSFREDYFKDGGYVCPAFIEYAPVYQATNARGEWQYVVNVKPWSQNVRLEQCFYPMAKCSYVSTSINSQCVQKYSFQRLVAYEPQNRGGRGLYTDVFRLPTACSCHIRSSNSNIGKTRGRASGLQSDASQTIDSRLNMQPAQSSNYVSTNMDVSPSEQSANSPLVERRRIRPTGLSPSEITASRREDGSDSMDYIPPPNNDNGPNSYEYGPPLRYNGPAQRFGEGPGHNNYDGPPYQGDGSRSNPNFANMPPSGYANDFSPPPGHMNRGPPPPSQEMNWRQQQDYGPPGPPGPPRSPNPNMNMRGMPQSSPNYFGAPDRNQNSGGNTPIGFIDWNSRNQQGPPRVQGPGRNGAPYDGMPGPGMLPPY